MENKSKKIELPISFGLLISKILREKHNIQPRTNSMGMLDLSFTEQELSLITSLELKNPIYKKLAAYGHMGRIDLDVSFERLDKVEELKKYL